MEKYEIVDKAMKLSGLDKEYHEIVTNKDLLRRTTEKFLHNLIDEFTLEVILDIHRKIKSNCEDLNPDPPQIHVDDIPNIDIFGQHNIKKTQECVCPNCDRAVAAARFAPHLEQCMGMGRSRSRNASRRIANNSKEREATTYGSMASDDEDDVDWNSGEKRRKKKERNGNKKGKGTPKKLNEPESIEQVNVDVEGDEDSDMSNLRDLLQDHSNGSSPADSVGSTGSIKKRDKAKSKKSSKKDRSSPNSNLCLE